MPTFADFLAEQDAPEVEIPRFAPGQPGTASIAYRNNNPGNIRVPGKKEFRQYSTPQEGFKDIENNVRSRAKQGHTLESYISKYAPANDDNDTEAYINNAASALSVDRNTPLLKIDPAKLAAFQAHQESGTKVQPKGPPSFADFLTDPANAPAKPKGVMDRFREAFAPSDKPVTSSIPALRNRPALTEEQYLERVHGQGNTPDSGLGPTVEGLAESGAGAKSLITGKDISGLPIPAARAARQVLGGALNASTPALAPAFVAAPVATAVTLGAGAAAQQGTEAIAEKAGLSPDAAGLTGDVAGLVAGGIVGHGLARRAGAPAEEALPVAAEAKPQSFADFLSAEAEGPKISGEQYLRAKAAEQPPAKPPAQESAEVFQKEGPTYAELFEQADQKFNKLAARRARSKPEVPETGDPHERENYARENLAQHLEQKPYAELKPEDQQAIDDLVRQHYGASVAPTEPVAPAPQAAASAANSDIRTESTPEVPQVTPPPAETAGASALPEAAIPPAAAPPVVAPVEPPAQAPALPQLNEPVRGTHDLPLVTEVVKPGTEPLSFETAKGSRYESTGNGTSRFKAATGEQFKPSDQTVYVAPDVNRRVMEELQANNVGGTRASVRMVGDKLAVVVKDRKTGTTRDDLSKTIPFATEPKAGLHPVELWHKNAETGEYGFHLGHEITKISKEAAEPERKFSSTQVNLPEAIAAPVRAYGLKIPESKLAEGGRENQVHATVLYGLHSAAPEGARAAIEGHGPITAKIGKLSVFKTDDADVLKFDVESPDLHALNAKVAGAVEHTNTHPDYVPHITLAYLKKGEGKHYAGRPVPGVTGKTVTFDKVTFSPHEGEKTDISLSKKAEPAEVKPLAKGHSASVYTPNETKAEVEYQVVPASHVRTSFQSGGDAELQPRSTDRIGSRQRIEELKGTLNPEKMGESVNAGDGAPIMLPDGQLLTRNHGTQALQELYGSGSPKAKAYKQWLQDNAEKFGLDPKDIAKEDQPVLVRRMKNPGSKADLVRFAEEANMSTTARMSDAEQAGMLAKRMTGKIMESFNPKEDGTPNPEFVQALLADLPPQERAAFMDANGRLSQSGQRSIRNAVFAKAYPDPSAIERMSESTDSGVRNISNGMLAAASRFARMQDNIANGERFDLGIESEAARAAEVLETIKEQGVTAEQWLNQENLFGRDPVVDKLVEVFAQNRRSSKRIGEVLGVYNDLVDRLGSPKQTGMFGAEEPPNRAELIDAANEAVRQRNAAVEAAGKTGELFPEGAAGDGQETGAPGKLRSGETGQPQAAVEEPADITAAKARLKARFSSERGSASPKKLEPSEDSVFEDLRNVGAYYVKRGVTQFADWSKSMVEDFGEAIIPMLEKTWGELAAMRGHQEKEAPAVAAKPAPAPASEPEIKPSKLAQGVEEKAIANKLTSGFEGIPEYTKVKVADQARSAAELLKSDRKRAVDIAMGNALPLDGLLPESVFVAVENHAIATKDVALLRDLATSSGLSMEATGMGQRIRMLAERDPESPVAAIQQVTKAREDAATRRYGSKPKEKVVVEIRKEIRQAAPKMRDWAAFVDSLKCT